MPDYQCPNCSQPVAADASFCSNCGQRLTLAPKTASVTPGDPTIAGWAAPSSAAGPAPVRRAWWKRWWGVAAIGLVVLLVLGGIGTALGGGKAPGGTSSPASSSAVGAITTPTPAEIDNTEPTADQTVTPPPPAKATSYATPNDRQWAQIVKSPDKYIGKGYHIWACITQFDAATGSDTFRGDASNKKEQYWSLYGDNALFNGTEAQLADFVTDDIVIMNVTSLGSYSYDTQIGGNTTVPLFQVDSIGRKGSCK